MSRAARPLSQTGCYHIIFRGVNHCHLFEQREDFERFYDLLMTLKSNMSFKLHAYCLMDNHAHLLIRENISAEIALIMRKLLGTYASWFNRKYGRSGALIANRYKSECVENDAYLLALVRYIHQNPLVAGIVKEINEYRWSSYHDYTKDRRTFTDIDLVLEIFSLDPLKAVENFKAFHGKHSTTEYSFSEGMKRSEEDVRRDILAALSGMEPHIICSLPRQERDAMLASLRRQGFTLRQLERATGISKSVIAKA
jgi:REP element-mobilizing transposase RayT